MDLKEVINILKAHNEWRRSSTIGEMPYSPETIGKAIDSAINHLKELETIKNEQDDIRTED